MRTVESIHSARLRSHRWRSILGVVAGCVVAAIGALGLFYLSLIATSEPVSPTNMQTINRAIDVLVEKGFVGEARLLRYAVTYRSTDNWFNRQVEKENAYAATNFPFEVITVYPDFYTKSKDDTERAMILLHEAQHLKGKDERAAYTFVWQNRERLGWTQRSHGTTESYITIKEQTRENAPELFSCPSRLWNDCTESLVASSGANTPLLR